MEKFIVGYRAASAESGFPERSLRTWVKNGIVPHTRIGYRTVLFRLSEIERALKRRTVKERGTML